MPASHKIQIELEVDGTVERPVLPPLPRMDKGDTVSYVAPKGRQVVIQFPDLSPFQKDGEINTEIDADSTPHLVVVEKGRFECRCFIVKENNDRVGWDTKHLKAGGVHDVGHEP